MTLKFISKNTQHSGEQFRAIGPLVCLGINHIILQKKNKQTKKAKKKKKKKKKKHLCLE